MTATAKGRARDGSSATNAPSPPGLPLLGHALQLQRHGQLRFSVANWHRYGDIVRLQLGPFTAHTLAHPDHIRHVLIDNRQNYDRGRGYRVLRLLTGRGLLTSEGAFWTRQRRLIQPAFTPKAVPSYATTVTRAADATATRWAAPARQGTPVDVNQAMLALALNIIGHTMLSLDLDQQAGDLVDAFTTAVTIVGARITAPLDVPLALPTPANRRLQRALRTLDRGIYTIMARRRQDGGPDDLLARLIAARDHETGRAMSPRQVRDEIITIFFAGHETIAQTLTWLWYLLSQHPASEQHLHAELHTVLAGRTPTVTDLANLPYTRAVVEETMRLYPAVWAIPRGTIADDSLAGFAIPAGSMVFPAPYLAHRHPDFWDEPQRFLPDRFHSTAQRPSCVYLPFGAGPRACIGQNYALQEALLVVATIAQRYRLRLVPGHPVVPHSAITLSPQHAMPMSLTPR